MTRLLLVEDDLTIVSGLKYALEQQNYTVDVANTIKEAHELFNQHDFNLLILDINLPDGNGLDFCQEIRQTSNIPIIFLTASETENNIVIGLELGADDYITKPFVPLELIARVKSHLRRHKKYLNALNQTIRNSYTVGGLEIDLDTKEVSVDGRIVKVTPIEFKILELLMKSPGRVYSASQIYEIVWQEEAIATDTVMVHIRNLREKIEIDPKNPRYIKVVWGVGYKIDKI